MAATLKCAYDRLAMRQPQDIFESFFAGGARARSLEAGQHLFSAGDPVVSLFFVVSGRVRLLRYAPEGSVLCLQAAGDGETIAEASLFAERYHCDAVAERPSRVKVVSKQEVLEAFRSDAEAGLKAMAHLARQVQSLRAGIEIMAMKSARSRLLSYLEWIREPGEDSLEIKRSWKEVSSEIGLSHEVVYRTLAALEEEGLIDRRDRRVDFLDK